MPEIAPDLLRRLRDLLCRSSVFASDATLRDLFADQRIYAWRNDVPSGRTPAERVNALVRALQDRYDAQGNNALLAFLNVLKDQEDPNTNYYQALQFLTESLAIVWQNMPSHDSLSVEMVSTSLASRSPRSSRVLLAVLISIATIAISAAIAITPAEGTFLQTIAAIVVAIVGTLAAVAEIAGLLERFWLEGVLGKSDYSVELDQRNRQVLLRKVQNFWIEGILQNSLHGAARIKLGMETQAGAVKHPWDMELYLANQPNAVLPRGTRIVDIFDLTLGALLILGEPGSGKTTTLLELARDLIARAEKDFSQPVPVVLNLSSFAVKLRSFEYWLVNELSSKYSVPRGLARRWIAAGVLLLLLDGLDEVHEARRAVCVSKINDFLQKHNLVQIAVCSRPREYAVLMQRLRLGGAVMLQPLTFEQIDTYLEGTGLELRAVRATIRQDASIQELVQSPLLLSILVLAYRGKSIEDLQGLESLGARRHHLFETYVERMFERRAKEQPYTQDQTIHWLAWLATRGNIYGTTSFLAQDPKDALRNMLISVLEYVPMYGLACVIAGGLGSVLAGWSTRGLVVGLIYGLISGLISGLVYGLHGLIVDGEWGVILSYVFSVSTRRIPWNSVGFLDYAVERIFLRKVGGGYIFIHRSLQEYFASLSETPEQSGV